MEMVSLVHSRLIDLKIQILYINIDDYERTEQQHNYFEQSTFFKNLFDQVLINYRLQQ